MIFCLKRKYEKLLFNINLKISNKFSTILLAFVNPFEAYETHKNSTMKVFTSTRNEKLQPWEWDDSIVGNNSK